MNKMFYWSLADETPSFCNRSRAHLWRMFMWIMLWVMLFGGGVYID